MRSRKRKRVEGGISNAMVDRWYYRLKHAPKHDIATMRFQE